MWTHGASLTYKTIELSENRLELVHRKILESSEPQLVMKPRLVGICRSDIKEFLGTRTVRHDFGHEILAEIIHSNVQYNLAPRVGDLVVLDPHIKITRTSGFGDLIVASGSAEDLSRAFIKVPSSIAKDRLIFIEPLACTHHCVANLLRFKQEKSLRGLSVGIVGAGMTGALIGLLCKYYGATTTIINRGEKRLRFLASTRIFNTVELTSSSNVEQKFDVVIPTTTFLLPEVLKLCEEIVKEAGLVLLYGGTRAGDTLPGAQEADIDSIRRHEDSVAITANAKRFTLCGTHGATTDDFMHVIRLLESYPGLFPVEKFINNRIKLEEVPEAIARMAREETLGKTLVDFSYAQA